MRKVMLAVLAAFSTVAAAAPAVVHSPYKYLSPWEPAQGVQTWAFARGECGEERWGEVDGAVVAAANVSRFVQAGVGYIVSTGGQGNIFTCATDEGMELFVSRYISPQLIGFDFDIEHGQTAAQIDSLVTRIALAQRAHPQLRFSFTIATHAASDGSARSLNETGEQVLAALRKHGVQDYVLNLMVMDFGPASRKACVVRRGLCDMAASAIQAAQNVHHKYKVPFAQIELTPMIGVNDVAENVYTLDDARATVTAVRKMGMAGIHFWSLERDQPCGKPSKGAEANCSSMANVAAGAYRRILAPAAALPREASQ
ncbi:glycosyl hydrolase [Pseudoduganella sp. S-14]|jgi:chitinase|uniref:glycosyl hydrolase n=1 Tax=Pseudoduganella sp. S-14 TaxID=3404065 RepID=UPI003CE6D793